MNEFGHDHIAVDAQSVSASDSFKTFEEQIGKNGIEVGTAAITTPSQEMGLSGMLEPHQSVGHGMDNITGHSV